MIEARKGEFAALPVLKLTLTSLEVLA